MFIIRLLRFLLGYVKFEATGVFCERFINLCSYGGIKIWAIIKREDNPDYEVLCCHRNEFRPFQAFLLFIHQIHKSLLRTGNRIRKSDTALCA